jgi:signal transduction histidine kinase
LDWSLDPRALPYTIFLSMTAIIAASLGFYVLRRRALRGALIFSAQMWGLAFWTLAYVLEVASRSLETKIFWNKVEYPWTFVALLAWLGVALHYSGRDDLLTFRNMALAAVMPVITTVLAFTNPRHHLIWTRIWIDEKTPALVATHGPWFWIHVAYCYLLLAFCSVLVLRRAITSRTRRSQSIPLLVSVFAPWTGNALHLAGLTPSAIDPTPFFFTVSGIALGYGLLRLHLLDIVPLARTQVIEGMSDGMMVLDRGGRVMDLNPAARRTLGVARSGALGRPLGEMLAPFPSLAGSPWEAEGRSSFSIGAGTTERHYDLDVAHLLDLHGEPAGRVAIFRDVTAGKQAALDLAGEHARLKALIQSSRDGILLLGTTGSLEVVNAPALHLLHAPGDPDTWTGRPVEELLQALEACSPELLGAFRGQRARGDLGQVGSSEGEYEIPPHVVRWVNLAVETREGALGRLLVLRDVTEERSLDRARDELTHTMVHDLRNPLTAIRGALEILQASRPTGSGPDADMMRVARDATERLLGLVRAILDVSQLENGRMPLERQIVALRSLVSETFDYQEHLAREKNVRLQNRVSTEHLWVDPGLLRRVLQNLVDNAIKFTPDGGEVTVVAEREPSASSLRVLVKDTGPGVPVDIRGQLFQKFVAGRHPRRGSGLGLAFCRLAVEAHGGRIWLEDEALGATIVFTVPVAP